MPQNAEINSRINNYLIFTIYLEIDAYALAGCIELQLCLFIQL